MSQLLDLFQGSFSLNSSRSCSFPGYSFTLLQHKSWTYNWKYGAFHKYRGIKFSLQGSSYVVDRNAISSLPNKANSYDGATLDSLPHVQTLGDFPEEGLLGKVVMVRFDSNVLLGEKQEQQAPSMATAVFTIKYLYEAGAKVILVSSWIAKTNSKFLTAESVAEHLSSVLQLSVVLLKSFPGDMQPELDDSHKSSICLLENLSQLKQDLANCLKFAEELSSGVDIFVNDDFFQSHKVLASTVGITSFCYASVAGFHFEEGLHQLKKAFKINRKPYVAISRLEEVIS